MTFFDLCPVRFGSTGAGLIGRCSADCGSLVGAGFNWPHGSDWVQGPGSALTGDRKLANRVCVITILITGVLADSFSHLIHQSQLRGVLSKWTTISLVKVHQHAHVKKIKSSTCHHIKHIYRVLSVKSKHCHRSTALHGLQIAEIADNIGAIRIACTSVGACAGKAQAISFHIL